MARLESYAPSWPLPKIFRMTKGGKLNEAIDPWFAEQPAEQRAALTKRVVAALDSEGVAHDIGSYADAPAGLRIWGGATVERCDLEALLPWIDGAYEGVKAGTL